MTDPDVLAQEVINNLETALDQFNAVVEGVRG
jgi:hypothetical protein